MTDSFLFTSESVSEGHPDKVCDQISDAVLDAVLKDDPKGRVACETFITVGLVIVGGEITTHTYFVGEDVSDRYDIHVVSLASNEENFFDYEQVQEHGLEWITKQVKTYIDLVAEIAAENEPITPLIDRVRQLYEELRARRDAADLNLA